MPKKKSQKFVSAKIRKIKKEGIRGKKVSQKQAVAVAMSMARKKGMKVGKKGMHKMPNGMMMSDKDMKKMMYSK